jgi:hypothetical protein
MAEVTNDRVVLARALAHELEWEALKASFLTRSDRLVNLAEDVRRLLDGEDPAHDWLSPGVRDMSYPPAARSLLALIADHRPRCNEKCAIHLHHAAADVRDAHRPPGDRTRASAVHVSG